jgi:hypothetical protein
VINLEAKEKEKRIQSLKRYASKFDLKNWSQTIVQRINEEKERVAKMVKLSNLNFETLKASFSNAKRPIFFLDYDVIFSIT